MFSIKENKHLFYKKNHFILLIKRVSCIFISLTLFACNTTKLLPNNQSIVVKQKIQNIDNEHKNEASNLLKPKTNRKFLGLFRINLWVYLKAKKGKSSKFKNGLLNTFGEAPALFDSSTIEKNTEILNQYLFDKGFFNNQVSYLVKIKKRKAKITYFVEHGKPYEIKNYEFQKSNFPIDSNILAIQNKSLIKKNSTYDLQKLNAERNRIAKHLRQIGYYFFDKSFLAFEVDTNFKTHQLNIKLKIKKAEEKYIYEKFWIDSIIINPNFNLKETQELEPYRDYYFYKHRNNKLAYFSIYKNILVHPDELFSENKLRLTQSKLLALNVFNYVNLIAKPFPSDTGINKINIYINLSNGSKRKIEIEAEGNTNNGNTLGIIGNLRWQNKNLFKGAEFLEFNLKGGLESQQSQFLEEETGNRFFNTFEYGGNVSLLFPRFIFPMNNISTTKLQSTKSRFSLSYFQQNRLDYRRAIFNLSFGYEWTTAKDAKLTFVPFEVILGNTTSISSTLQNTLDSINNPFLKFSFSDHLTTSTRLSFTKSNIKNINWLDYLRFNIESAGNLLNSSLKFLSNEKIDTLFGLPFFQYLRLDVDLRKYFQPRINNTLAMRFFVGLGIPLNDLNTLPIEKRYFIGGANSLRAWQARTLGAGSYNSYQNQIDQFGELKMEFNLEYRFKIVGSVKGAFFLDGGNIWALNDTVAERQNGNFEFNKFYKDLALGTGFGLRFDFKYFIIRTDLGIKMRDPAFEIGNRFVLDKLFDKDWKTETWRDQISPSLEQNQAYRFLNLNIGINYPF